MDTDIIDEVSGGTTIEDVLRWRGLECQVGEVLSKHRGVRRLSRGRGRGVGDIVGEGGTMDGKGAAPGGVPYRDVS
jgi:hypothetical protein